MIFLSNMSFSKILNFLIRTVATFLVGSLLNIALTVIFLYPLLSLYTAGVDHLELYVLFLSNAIASVIVFSIPTRRPLFAANASFLVRIGAMILAVLILLLCYVGNAVLSFKMFELEKENNAIMHVDIERKNAYLHDNYDALMKLYGNDCFVLTAQNETYPLDQKYTAMSEGERFSALMGLRLPKGAQAYCTDELKYYLDAPGLATPANKISATINSATLHSSSAHPVVTGTATGVSSVYVSLADAREGIWNNPSVSVVEGKWSVVVSPEYALPSGTYYVLVKESENVHSPSALLTQKTLVVTR